MLGCEFWARRVEGMEMTYTDLLTDAGTARIYPRSNEWGWTLNDSEGIERTFGDAIAAAEEEGIRQTLNNIASTIPKELVSHVAVCEFSSEDSTPTLHVDLWRGNDLCDLPEQVAGLNVVAEGFWDGGRSYSLKLN